MSYNIMWMFIGCGLLDLIPLVGSLSVLVTARVYMALGPPVYTRTITKTERLPTKGMRSCNPQPINIHIILYDINHSPIDKMLLPIVTQSNMTVPEAAHTVPELLMMGE